MSAPKSSVLATPTLSSTPSPGKILYMHSAHRYGSRSLASKPVSEWSIYTTFGPYGMFSEGLTDTWKLSMNLAEYLFEDGSEVIGGQVGRRFIERTERQWSLGRAYMSLFHVPFRSYGATAVSDQDGEDNVRQESEGREDHRELVLADGTRVLVREIQPEDAPALQRLVGRLSDQTAHLRFFGPMRELSDK